jgi:hypothetical protein
MRSVLLTFFFHLCFRICCQDGSRKATAFGSGWDTSFWSVITVIIDCMKALIILYGEKAVTMSSMYMLKMGLVWK